MTTKLSKTLQGRANTAGKGLINLFKRPGTKDSPPVATPTSDAGTQTAAPPPVIKALAPRVTRQPILVEVRYPDHNEVHAVQLRSPLRLRDIAGANAILAVGEKVRVSWNFGDRHIVEAIADDEDFPDVVAMMELRGWRDHFVLVFTESHSKRDLLAVGSDKTLMTQKKLDESRDGTDEPKNSDGSGTKHYDYENEAINVNGNSASTTPQATGASVQTLPNTSEPVMSCVL